MPMQAVLPQINDFEPALELHIAIYSTSEQLCRLLPCLEACYAHYRSFLPLQANMHQPAMYSAALLSH